MSTTAFWKYVERPGPDAKFKLTRGIPFPPDAPLLTLAEAGAYLRLSAPSVRKLIDGRADTRDDSLHLRKGFRWQNREFGTSPLLVNLIYNPRICAIAEQLLGPGKLQPPTIDGKLMGSEGPPLKWPDAWTNEVSNYFRRKTWEIDRPLELMSQGRIEAGR